jgi:hypothetical protein
MSQTCIIRYQYPFFIILHPMTPQFAVQYADVNVNELKEEENRLIQEAKKSGNDTVLLDGEEIKVEKFQLTSLHLIRNIKSYYRQTLRNGLVIKMVENKQNKVTYVVKV